MLRGAGRGILPGNDVPGGLMDDAQHSLQRKLEQERRHLACLCAGFAQPHGHGDEADNARDEMAELLARSHAGLCAARIRALEGLLGDLRCSGRRLCMDCGEEIPLSRLLAAFIVSGLVLLAGLVFLSPYQGPVVAYKLALVMVAAIAGMAFDFLAFPYALPSSYLDKDWREDPEATGDDGQPDFPIATGYFRPFCAAMLRRACIIAAFVLAVALGL